jgi:serine/threonine protein phosphatase PrpC
MLLCLSLSAVFLELLVMLPLSSTALAAPRLASPPPTDEYLANAGVSLVRLLVNFNNTNGPVKSTLPCTGLGVLVGSWDSSGSTQFNASILTDGNLFNTKSPLGCISVSPVPRSIASVQIFFSDSYNHSSVKTASLQQQAFSLTCLDEKNCGNGPALLSFHSAVSLPFLVLAQNSSTPAFNLALTNEQGQFSPPKSLDSAVFSALVSSFVTPKGFSSTESNFPAESGYPEVTKLGLLLSLHLSSGQNIPASSLSSFLQSEKVLTHPETDLQKNWQDGVIRYYATPSNQAAAKQSFQLAAKENSQFQAPDDFLESLPGSNSNGNGGKTPVTKSVSQFDPSQIFSDLPLWLVSTSNFGFVKLPNWALIVIGLLLLLIVFALFSLLITSYRRRREFRVAERKASIDASRIGALEASQPPAQLALPDDWSQQPTAVTPSQQSPILPPHPSTVRTGALPKHELHCPRCLQVVPADANYCTHCSLLLSPSESGFHLRVKGNGAPQPIVLPSPSSPSPASFAALQSQPTQTFPLAAVRPSSIVDHPTIEMSPTTLNGSSSMTDQTLPLLQVQGRRMGFAVGTHSDPGIKRKFKPNEDSLFAAQGLRNPQQAEFGLFVVADGMGGHANGQDASRRAIQTIVDYMVPKLMHSGDASPEMLESLLQDGVQQANQAVHRNNVELRADMGTTMTATLVIDATAYVCNVGDSRTYLYRQSDGLHKVTNDHSVVASLVEAGIIKPDDIYTHPKRNQIYRSLGEKMNVEVDSFRVPLKVGDKLLLCSDGLWDMVRDPKIEDVIKNPLPDPNQTASDLISAALEGGGEDNVSVIVISVTEPANYGLNTDFRLIAKPDSVQMPPM